MEVRGHTLKLLSIMYIESYHKKSKTNNLSTFDAKTHSTFFLFTSVTLFLLLVCPYQGGGCVCPVSVCARTAGPAKAAVAPSPQPPANQLTACFAAGGGDACVASVCATIPDTLETSVRDVRLAKAPAIHTGTCQLLFATAKHDGRTVCSGSSHCRTPSVFCLPLRKCVDCHLSHGLTQKEAGQCNSTCAPLVGYMDDMSGTVTLANRICSRHSFTHWLCICSFCGSEES